jgi:hypothetical protein
MADKKISALPAATTPLAGTEVLPIVQGGTTDQVSIANLTAGRAVSALSLTATQDVIANRKIVVTGAGTIEQNGGAGGLYFANSAVSGGATNQRFYTTNGSGAAQLQLQLAGGNTPTNDIYGNLTAATGNLVVGTAGKGIDFSANTGAPGMTSELLDWYEEGTWTPNFNSFTFTGTQTVLTATYTRIGRLVFLQATFSNSLTQAASGGTSYIDNLPFPAATSATIMFMNEATAASIGVGEVYGINDRLYPPSYSTSVANDVILMSGCYIV